MQTKWKNHAVSAPDMLPKTIVKQLLEFSKLTKVVFMGEILRGNPLDELIGILKITKPIDIEKIIDEKGFGV